MNNGTSAASHETSCYFCNEVIEERYLPGHVQQCGAVLVKCPENCGSYIPRRSFRSHRRNCPKRNRQENSISSLKTVSVPFIKNEATWRDNVFAALSLLRSAVADCERDRKWLIHNLAINADRLDSQEKSLEALRQMTVQDARDARQRTIAIGTVLSNFEKAFIEAEERTSLSFNEVAYRLESLEHSSIGGSETNEKKAIKCEAELKELKTFVVKESAVVADLWDSQTERLNDLKLDLEIRRKISKELEDKQDLLSEKVNLMWNEMKGHADEIRRKGESVKKLKFQVKEIFKILEELVIKDLEPRKIDNYSNFQCASTNGRLLWRIDRYKEKITEAKETDAVIYSPVFQNKEYGYALRMELFLNGKRQWRGRHVIGCLRVIEGPWDPLLDWPCILRATVTLRDQENPANNIRKFVKTRSRGQDNSDSLEKDAGLDMFIPHTSLTRYSGFTKHNVIFLDIQVTELRESLSTSSLSVA